MIRAIIFAFVSVVLLEILLGLGFFLLPLVVLGARISIVEIIEFIPAYSFYVSLVTGVILIIIGIPVFIFLKKKNKDTTTLLALIGFFVPIVIYVFMSNYYSVGEGFSSGGNYYGTYRDMIVNGVRTPWGWLQYTEDIFKFGIHGLAGAVVFKHMWYRISEKNNAS